MTILIAYASKHGATRKIAEQLGVTLEQMTMRVEIRPVEAVTSLDTYEAVVIGSAVYYGSWLRDAADFVERNRTALAACPVWLFSSGPLGAEGADGRGEPKEIAGVTSAIHPRDHHIFFGALDRDKLSFTERMVVKAVHAPAGDYRDWDEIAAWAEGIARALVSARTQSPA